MKPFVASVTAIVLLGLCAPARAQQWEASATAAYVPSAGLDKQAPELTGLKIEGGLAWGVQVSRSFTPHWSAEVSFTQQPSSLQLEAREGNGDLFDMSVGQLHANAVRLFGEADSRLRPFVFAGIGATFLSGDFLESETKLSFGLGAGVKYFRWERIGLRAHIQYKPIWLNDGGSTPYCDPFGFCQGALHQFELAGGVLFRF